MLKKRLGVECIERKWWSNRNLKDYFKITSPLIIPESCVRIGSLAFIGCDKLEKVIIPESVEWIGYCAFYDCKNATIILKKPMSEFGEIGGYVFDGVRNVKEETRN